MLELECLSCGFKWDTDNEDEVVEGICPLCNEYIYNECGELDRFLPPSQSDYRDYSCHCEDAPCCSCNSESGQIAVLYIAIVAILAYVLHTFLMPFVTPVLATLDGLQ